MKPSTKELLKMLAGAVAAAILIAGFALLTNNMPPSSSAYRIYGLILISALILLFVYILKAFSKIAEREEKEILAKPESRRAKAYARLKEKTPTQKLKEMWITEGIIIAVFILLTVLLKYFPTLLPSYALFFRLHGYLIELLIVSLPLTLAATIYVKLTKNK